MQKSSRILGKEIGFSDQQMNWLLKEQGYLAGVPGNYSPTDKALPFVVEEAMHEGSGGYYRRDWDKRTFDDSIMEKLDLSEEALARAKKNLSIYRAEYRAEQRKARELAETAEENARKLAEEAAMHKEEILKYIGIGAIAILSIGGICVLVQWRKKKKAETEKDIKDREK